MGGSLAFQFGINSIITIRDIIIRKIIIRLLDKTLYENCRYDFSSEIFSRLSTNGRRAKIANAANPL